MESPLTPREFAAKIQPVLGLGPSVFTGPTVPGIQAQTAFDAPGVGVPAANQAGGWKDVLKKAWAAANPFSTTSPTQNAIAIATKDVSAGGAKVLAAAASTVQSAGAGVKSGFQFVTILLLLAVGAYLLAVMGPFVPKPRVSHG